MPASGPPRDGRQELFWRRILQRFAESGLSAEHFCRLHQLPLASLLAWQRTLQPRRTPDSAPSTRRGNRPAQPNPATPLPVFLPLTVQRTAATQPEASASVWEVLLPDGLRLRVPPGFDPDRLARLLALLRGAAC
jgi:hypothetical protein